MIGTIISSLTTCVWIEPHVLYKYGFKKSAKEYVKKYIEYMIVFLIAVFLCLGACKGIDIAFGGAGDLRSAKAIGVFAVQFIFTVIISNGFLWLIYRKSDNYKYLLNVVKKKVLKK